jgi:hypothetical protein
MTALLRPCSLGAPLEPVLMHAVRNGVSKAVTGVTLRRPRRTSDNRTLRADERADLARFTDGLSQPLTAAANYMGTARLLLQSTEANANAQAAERLRHAEIQIVRAGAVLRQIRARLD